MKERRMSVRVLALGLLLALLLADPVRAAVLPVRRAAEGGAALRTAPALRERRLGTEPALRVVRSDERGVELELSTPAFQVVADSSDAGPCRLIRVPGFGETAAAGWPALPVRVAMVGIPPQAAPTLTVLSAEVETRRGEGDLCPAVQFVEEWDEHGQSTLVEARLRDREAYATAGFYPPLLAEVASTAFVRSQRVAQVRFYPFRYNPVTGELKYYRTIRVRLDFGVAGGGALVDEGGFEEVISRSLLNAAEARQWRTSPAPAPLVAGMTVEGGPLFQILVDQDGIYRLTHADLLAAGLPLDQIDPRTLHLFHRQTEVAIWVVGEEDGTFDPQDYVLFYGQKMDSRYTDVNVYRLTWGGGWGLRMGQVDGSIVAAAPLLSHFRTAQRVEENHVYDSRYTSGPDNDHWYWTQAIAFSPLSLNYEMTLQHIATAPFSATVRGLLRGVTAYPASVYRHHARIYLNGYLIKDALWAVGAEYSFAVDVPSSVLTEGLNTITVEIPRDQGGVYELLYVNRFEIEYDDTFRAEQDRLAFDGDAAGTWTFRLDGFSAPTVAVFDITEPFAPRRVVSSTVEWDGNAYSCSFGQTIAGSHRYLALTPEQWLSPLRIEPVQLAGLRSPDNGADYILITHADFYTAVLPLADHRAAQGLRTVVVDVQDIYNEFNDGIFDPQAIRDFLAYAYHFWTRPAPAYVLLVGDGNYDFKNYGGYNEPQFIPPYLADVDAWVREVPVDNRYVCVSGDDVLPDMHIGRLPVKTSAEATAVVNKILSYEQAPPPGEWNQRVLFVADNADSAGNFAQYSDILVNGYLPSPYQPVRVYLGVTHPYEMPSVAAHAAVIQGINEGALVVNYIGHAGTLLWAIEKLLQASEVPQLVNGGRLPLVVAMACSDGYFILPSNATTDFSSTAERMVRAPGGGAIASWSATGLGLAYIHDYLNRGLFQALFFDDVTRLGPATMQGKLYLYGQTSAGNDQIEEYTLFGDPALALNVLPADVGIAQRVEPAGELHPGDVITYTLVYSNAGPATARHVVITDLLPSALVSPLVTFSGAAVTPRADSRFVWDVADLAAGEGGVITVTATVDRSFVGWFSHTVTIGTTTGETDASNNVAAPLSSHVVVADLLVWLEGPEDVEPGVPVTYTVNYFNAGQAAAEDVVIRYTPSAGVTTVRRSAACQWNLGVVDGGEGGSIALPVQVDAAYRGWVTHTVGISTSAWEISYSNNLAVMRVRVGFPVLVDLLRFEGVARGNKVTVFWETASEVGLVGFYLYRSTQRNGPYLPVNSTLIPAQHAGLPVGAGYTWQERLRPGRAYYYILEPVTVFGPTARHGPIAIQTSPRLAR